jgi:hypothetical protein
MFPVYRARGGAQSWRMDDEPRRKRPWQPWQYLALIVIAVLAAVLLLRPLGSGLVSPFQAITSALSGQQR